MKKLFTLICSAFLCTAIYSQQEKETKIKELVLRDKSDEKALRILEKVYQNYDKNMPNSLDSYSFVSYDKISYDFDEDSIKAYNKFLTARIDSIKNTPNPIQTEKQKKDSLNALSIQKMLKTNKFFLWEKAQQYYYKKGFGERIKILDSRVSGLKQPLYEMFALRSNRTKMPKEVVRENRNLYRYFLTDSIEIEGRENYVIRFRQVDYRKTINRKKYNGYIYIDKESYAIKKIESNPKIRSEGYIVSSWKPINGKWFLEKETIKMKLGSMVFKDKINQNEKELRKKFGTYIFLNSEFFDFKTPIDIPNSDFKGYTIQIENTNGKELEKYRTNPLTQREQDTYTKLDSIGKKYKINQKIDIISALTKGKIRMGNVDFLVSNFLKYNLHEGLRLKTGFKFNERFHKYISPDFYVAYGFKDDSFKYGIGLDIKTTNRINSFFRLEYQDDVESAGRFSENMWNFRMKMMNSGINMKNDRYYHFRGAKISYETDISNHLSMRILAKREEEKALFDYNYKGLGDKFTNFSTMLTLKYSNSKNIMTPSGKFTYEQNFPEFYLNYEQGYQSLGGDFSFSRIDFLAAHQLNWRGGVTGLRIYGGLMTGDAPIWHHFQMNGLKGSEINKMNFNLTSYLGFATMEAKKYYNDKFLGFYLTHRLPWYFKSFGKNTSSFDLVYRGVIGGMNNRNYHQLEYESIDKLYQEIGLEWNNFLSTRFNLGFFYRIGHYRTDNFKDNLGIQFKFKFLGF